MKGVIKLPSTGYIRVHAYTSDAQIPLQDVSVAITDPNGNPIALRLTDRSGFIEPIPITVPEPPRRSDEARRPPAPAGLQ